MSAARRTLPHDARRGWCPSLARPMPTGDGLLARVHPPLGRLSVAQLRAVAEGGRRFGNGHVDVTARGNLQIRGVRAETAAGLASWLSEAGLGDARDDGGPQRLTLTSPLAGTGDLALARAVEADGLRIAGLPAKTLVAIVGAGVSGEGADLVVLPGEGRCLIALAGGAGANIDVPAADAVPAVAAMLRTFAATGRRRVHDLSAIERADLCRAGEHAHRAHPPPPSAGEGGPRVSEGRERGKPYPEEGLLAPLPPRIREAPSPAGGGGFSCESAFADLPIGVSADGTQSIFCVEAPFGRCIVQALDRLAEAAEHVAATDIRTTPARGFVLGGDGLEAAAILETLSTAGFVAHPDDPRRAIAACPGAPACASGTTPVPDHAGTLAVAFAPFAARGLKAHVSGCAKGCAHPASADLTLVAESGRYGIVLQGTPRDAPPVRLTFEAALDRVRRADPTVPLANAFRNPAR